MAILTYGKKIKVSRRTRILITAAVVLCSFLLAVRVAPTACRVWRVVLQLHNQADAFNDAESQYALMTQENLCPLNTASGATVTYNKNLARIPRTVQGWLAERTDYSSRSLIGWICFPQNVGENPGLLFFRANSAGGSSSAFFVPKASWSDLWKDQVFVPPFIGEQVWAAPSEYDADRLVKYWLEVQGRLGQKPTPQIAPPVLNHWETYLPQPSDDGKIRFRYRVNNSEGAVTGQIDADGSVHFEKEATLTKPNVTTWPAP